MAVNPVQLSAVAPTLLPPIITDPIFKATAEASAVQQLARRVPLAVNATTVIPVPMDVPTAGWVAEGAPKPVASGGVGIKTMTGKKVALLVPVSQEVVMTNPAGLYDQLVQDLPTAISRAFDYAAIHGLDLKTGGAGPFSDYLAMTPFSQVVGASAASAGGVYTDLVLGEQKVVNGSNSSYQFTGFAADPRLKPELKLSLDTVGRPLLTGQDQSALNATLNSGSLIGYPAFFNTGVSGKYTRSGDTVQTVTISGTPTGGTFTLSFAGATTGTIAYNAAASAVQTALRALPTASAADVTVSGSGGGPYTVTFVQAPGPLSVGANSLTGGSSPSVAVAQSPVTDSGLRAIGGDYSQCAWGQGMDITVKISTEASYSPDGGTTWVSAFQNNLTLLLVEAYYGFVVGDKTAFCAYTHAAGS